MHLNLKEKLLYLSRENWNLPNSCWNVRYVCIQWNLSNQNLCTGIPQTYLNRILCITPTSLNRILCITQACLNWILCITQTCLNWILCIPQTCLNRILRIMVSKQNNTNQIRALTMLYTGCLIQKVFSVWFNFFIKGNRIFQNY